MFFAKAIPLSLGENQLESQIRLINNLRYIFDKVNCLLLFYLKSSKFKNKWLWQKKNALLKEP